jgi:hypothetical protein
MMTRPFSLGFINVGEKVHLISYGIRANRRTATRINLNGAESVIVLEKTYGYGACPSRSQESALGRQMRPPKQLCSHDLASRLQMPVGAGIAPLETL